MTMKNGLHSRNSLIESLMGTRSPCFALAIRMRKTYKVLAGQLCFSHKFAGQSQIRPR
jgi:hypothetical protein